jgi:hypothetical protein
MNIDTCTGSCVRALVCVCDCVCVCGGHERVCVQAVLGDRQYSRLGHAEQCQREWQRGGAVRAVQCVRACSCARVRVQHEHG